MIEILASLVDAVICVWFITKSLCTEKKKAIITIPAIFIYFLITLFCDKYLSGFSMLASFILFVPALGYAFLICRRHFIKAIISCCIYKAVIIISSSLLFTIISSIIDDFGVLMQGSDATIRVIYLVLHKIIVISIFSAALVVFKNSSIDDVLTGMLVFGSSLVTIIGLGASMIIIARSDIRTDHVSSIVLICAFLIINVGVYAFVNRIKNLEKQKFDLLIVKEKYDFQNEKYRNAVSIWSKIKKIQHDIKNNLLVIDEKLEAKQYDECKNYVESLIPKTIKIGDVIHTGNDILDYLVNTKLAVLENVDVNVSGIVSDLSDIPETDLVSIFGNIIDNMAEAIAPLKEKNLKFQFAKEEENRIMIFQNSIAGSVLEKNKELNSTKASDDLHGIGHIIVEDTLKKYGGLIHYSESDNMFIVQIILPINE